MNERSASSNHIKFFIVGTDSTASNRSTRVERTGIAGIDERLSQVQTHILTLTALEDRCCWGIWGQRILNCSRTQQPLANRTLLVHGEHFPGAAGSSAVLQLLGNYKCQNRFPGIDTTQFPSYCRCVRFFFMVVPLLYASQLFMFMFPLYLTCFSVKKKNRNESFFHIV